MPHFDQHRHWNENRSAWGHIEARSQVFSIFSLGTNNVSASQRLLLTQYTPVIAQVRCTLESSNLVHKKFHVLRASTIEYNTKKGFIQRKRITLFWLLHNFENWYHLIILRWSVRHGTSSSRSSVLKAPQSTVDQIQQRFTLNQHLTWLTLSHLFGCRLPCQTILDQHSTDNSPKSVKCRPSLKHFLR